MLPAECLSSWISWFHKKLQKKTQDPDATFAPCCNLGWEWGKETKDCFSSPDVLSPLTANSHTWMTIFVWSRHNFNPECEPSSPPVWPGWSLGCGSACCPRGKEGPAAETRTLPSNDLGETQVGRWGKVAPRTRWQWGIPVLKKETQDLSLTRWLVPLNSTLPRDWSLLRALLGNASVLSVAMRRLCLFISFVYKRHQMFKTLGPHASWGWHH